MAAYALPKVERNICVKTKSLVGRNLEETNECINNNFKPPECQFCLALLCTAFQGIQDCTSAIPESKAEIVIQVGTETKKLSK